MGLRWRVYAPGFLPRHQQLTNDFPLLRQIPKPRPQSRLFTSISCYSHPMTKHAQHPLRADLFPNGNKNSSCCRKSFSSGNKTATKLCPSHLMLWNALKNPRHISKALYNAELAIENRSAASLNLLEKHRSCVAKGKSSCPANVKSPVPSQCSVNRAARHTIPSNGNSNPTCKTNASTCQRSIAGSASK